jgi:hypothetical protein
MPAISCSRPGHPKMVSDGVPCRRMTTTADHAFHELSSHRHRRQIFFCCVAARFLHHMLPHSIASAHLWVLAVAVQGAVPLLAGQDAVVRARGTTQVVVLAKGGLHIPRDPGMGAGKGQ